jgi:thiamine pyrophosphate-dependent acetolactate synthase large subunit-like protein
VSGPPETGRRVVDDVAAAVAAEGVRTVYGVLGDGNLHLALALEQVGVRWVSARHEQGAVAMADGAARRSGELAAASVTHGPGLTNAVTALTAAALAGSPVLVLTGDTPRTTRHHGQDIPQEPLTRATGAAWAPLRLPATAAEDVAVAARTARLSGRPVVLNLPVDLQLQPSAGALPRPLPALRPPRRAPAAEEVAALAAALREASAPLLLAGRGALDARDDLCALAESAGARLGTTLLARGLFAGHAADVGVVGGFASPEARAALVEVDLVIALGASLNRFTTASGRVCPRARWMQVDSAPTSVGTTTVPSAVVLADAAATASALREAVSGGPGRPPPSPVAVPGTPPGTPTGRAATGIDPRAALAAVDSSLPPRRQLVVGIGHYSGLAALLVGVADPRDQVLPWHLGSVGLALPVGLGVADVHPDRPTVVVEGDGGVLMNPAELDTLARLGLPVLVVVLDDAAYGAEVHLLRRHGLPDEIAHFPRRDLAGLARALGVRAELATTEAELRTALSRLLPLDGPALLHVHVDREVVHEEVFTALEG